jgi:uncharacterized membrane protein
MSSERLVMFTDAVAAIAITLLILPLLETISDAYAEHPPLGDLVHEHLGQFGAFVLSFAVIFRFWWGHHRLFGHLATINRVVVRWSVLWTFAIVFLPIPTAIIAAYRPSAASVGLYGGTLALASGSMAMLARYAYRHPELGAGRTPATREAALGNLTMFLTQVLATVIGAVFADTINFWAFLLMFLTNPVEHLIQSRWRR